MNFVRWTNSQWCNYACSYCDQQHARKQMYRGSPGHWADNAPVDSWIAAFRRFGRSSLHVTGGEPLLDRKNMDPLLAALLGDGWTVSIDTNGTVPTGYSVRTELMVSYHPEFASPPVFHARVAELIADGWDVTSAAFVVFPGRLAELRSFAAASSVPVNVMPLDFSLAGFTEDEVAELGRYIPPQDWYKTGVPTAGLSCRYPSVSYEIDPDGSVIVSCHRTAGVQYHGSVFGDLPARPPASVPCPRDFCSCEERYEHLDHLGVLTLPSPKAEHARRTGAWQRRGLHVVR